MIALKSEHSTVFTSNQDWPREKEEDETSLIYLSVNSLSFGSTTNTSFYFKIYYEPEHANFNFEKPPLDDYYATPRSTLDTLLEVDVPSEKVPELHHGYTSEIAQEFDPEFPDGFHQISWDYPITEMRKGVKYIHPNKKRLLTDLELEHLYGGCRIGDTPPEIIQYLTKHVEFYESKAWGDNNFSARYDKFRLRFFLTEYHKTPRKKEFDFRQWTPRFCHPISDRYPIPKSRKNALPF